MAENSARIMHMGQTGDARQESGEFPFVETSVSRTIRARLEFVHQWRRIAIFSGPPGIGKSWAVRAWAQDHSREVLIVKVETANRDKGNSPSQVLQMLAETLHGGRELARGIMPNTASQQVLRKHVCDTITWAFGAADHLTIVFDEAQNLSRAAIEMLRFWNDEDQSALPLPIGLVFVGNDEFSLKQDARGRSVISDAVRSRTLFAQTFERADLSDQDIEAFLISRGVTGSETVQEVLGFIKRDPRARHLRWVRDTILFCQTFAGNGPIDPAIVRKHLTGR